jgi:hypothetical protein
VEEMEDIWYLGKLFFLGSLALYSCWRGKISRKSIGKANDYNVPSLKRGLEDP